MLKRERDEYNEGFDQGVLQGDHERQGLKAEIERLLKATETMCTEETRLAIEAERDEAREAARAYRAIVREAYLIDLKDWQDRWPWLEDSE